MPWKSHNFWNPSTWSTTVDDELTCSDMAALVCEHQGADYKQCIDNVLKLCIEPQLRFSNVPLNKQT